MIVKHVAMRSLRKSSFGDLVRYLSNPKDTNERLGTVRIANCHSDDMTDAILEVMATQACNTRAKGDKTYHLIVSFRAGEHPPDDALADIEDRICAALGFADHQRVSAVHHDTDNLHIHLAINKVHPTRLTLHEPFLAYRTLADLCTTLEHVHGLEHDNHQTNKPGAANRAEDMERAAGIESLLGWIKRECLPNIQSSGSWAELHQALQSNGLVLRERGNGLVIENGDGLAVKASSVSRDISKAKLVARFGVFEPSLGQHKQPDATQTYRPRPLPSSTDTTELYARYKAEQQLQNTQRKTASHKARDQKNRDIEAARTSARTRRAAIKLLGANPLTKKLLYAQAYQALHNKIAAAQEHYGKEREAISNRYRRQAWQDWLQQQAKAGDKDALAVLRANSSRQGLKGNTLAGQFHNDTKPLSHPEHVTKKGTLIYRLGQTAVRDDGSRLSIASGANMESLQAALRMAAQRYGRVLTVAGSTEFKENIVRAAVTSKLAVRFNDPTMEQHQLALLAANHRSRRSIKPAYNTVR